MAQFEKFPIDTAEGFTAEEEAILRNHLQTIEDAIELGVLAEADKDNIYMVSSDMPNEAAYPLPLRKLDFAEMMMNDDTLRQEVVNSVINARAKREASVSEET